MASKEFVDWAMDTFQKLDDFGKSLTASQVGAKASDGIAGLRLAFERGSDSDLGIIIEEMEYEINNA